MDAYDTAIHVRLLRICARDSGEPSNLLSKSKGVRSVGNVCSGVDSGIGASAGVSGREMALVGSLYSARWVFIEGQISRHTHEKWDEWETYED